jgi:hypothetical protein
MSTAEVGAVFVECAQTLRDAAAGLRGINDAIAVPIAIVHAEKCEAMAARMDRLGDLFSAG